MMLVKILNSSGADFHGVKYNDKKIQKDEGELLRFKNFPTFINSENSQEVRDYLKSISKNRKVKKPQFHAVISTKFREHSKEELAKVAEEFMLEMDYGKQPYIVVFHNDTENNHVHIVSTRIDKSSGNKIKDSYEKLKAQRAIAKVMEKFYNVKSKEDIQRLKSYKMTSIAQMQTLFESNGFNVLENDKGGYDVLKNGVTLDSFTYEDIRSPSKQKNFKRRKQIKAILEKYKSVYAHQVFKVVDDREESKEEKIAYESELQQKMREMFGFDIIFYFKDKKEPFGFTLIDHKAKEVFKGSDIIKMDKLFTFTKAEIDKRNFERLKDYSLKTEIEKKILLEFLSAQDHRIKEFMLFENKKAKTKTIYHQIRKDVIEHFKSNQNPNITIWKAQNGNFYAIHQNHHHIQELQSLVGPLVYQQFLEGNFKTNKTPDSKNNNMLQELIDIAVDGSYTTRDTTEDEFKRRKRKRRNK